MIIHKTRFTELLLQIHTEIPIRWYGRGTVFEENLAKISCTDNINEEGLIYNSDTGKIVI